MHVPIDENFVPGPPSREITHLRRMPQRRITYASKGIRRMPRTSHAWQQAYQPFRGAGPPKVGANCYTNLCEGG